MNASATTCDHERVSELFVGACTTKGACLMNASATTCDHDGVSECVWELA